MEGQVGIIFLLSDVLLIEGTPVHEASNYGALKMHEKGHPDFWEGLQ
jgi:hypothetical protein